ncbi:MAG: CCA tRNA nucleotidyltransferase [Marinomonas sp.]
MAELSSAKWTRREGLAALVKALGADNIRWVGGCVRDTLLGIDVSDVDCATTHLPDAVMALCKNADIRTVPTGIDHGTVTAVLAGGPVEITTLRHDVSTDGRRATVAFASDWREDAARRDFTINALFAHPETYEISDYFGGMDDLAARRVRFIGEAAQRIREDHLRILRYFRFQARFGSEWDDKAVAACAELAATLKGLSRERVAMELLAICALPDPHAAFAKMHGLGVLAVILPEATQRNLSVLSALIAAEKAQGFAPSSVRRLAALLPALGSVAQDVAVRLRLSRAQRTRLVCAAERTETDADNPKALGFEHGVESAIDRLLIAGADASQLKDWEPPQFPLKGGEILARGVAAGPEIARLMHEIKARWVAEGFPDEARVQQLLDKALR